MEITEQDTTQVVEPVQNDEQVSAEPVDVSETEVTEVVPDKATKVDDFEVRLQSELDKRANSYREKREADTAYIRNLQEKLKELEAKEYDVIGNKRLEAILSGDEEDGIDTDRRASREKALKEFNDNYKEYKKNSSEVKKTVEFIDTTIKGLSKNIVDVFNLDDPNPNIRAKNVIKLIGEASYTARQNQIFLKVMERILPKGDELREQITEIISSMPPEFTDEKSQELYFKDRLQGVKVARKKPPSPSGSSGGSPKSNLSPVELIMQGLMEKEKSK